MINKILITLSSIILIAAFSHPFLYSQEQLVIDSLVTGKMYKVTLYNDKEIIGKVAKQDSLTAIIVTEAGTVRIRKEDIFSVSRNTVPKLMKAMVSMGGGLLLITGEEGYYNRIKPGYTFQLTGLMPFSENKAIRLDLSYGSMKREGYVYTDYYAYYSSESEQSRDIFSMHADFLFGDFKTETKFNVYGLGGAGIFYFRENEYSNTYYSYYDSTYRTSSYPGQNYVSFSLALGGGLRFKLSNRLGMYAEVQYNLSTHDSYYWFFGRGYFPITGGLTYTFY